MDTTRKKITFTVDTDIDDDKLRAVLSKLADSPKIHSMSEIWISDKRPVGRPAVNQQQIIKLLDQYRHKKLPLSNSQISRKLNLDRQAVYNAMGGLIRKGVVEVTYDEKWKCKRFKLAPTPETGEE
jgi:predicted regulator of amino acid metabolism with ACT domain